MPKKLSPQELQNWFESFSKVLYEKVNIDVKSKEDLGRIRAFFINNWTEADPENPEVEVRFACMPRDDNGEEYIDDPPHWKLQRKDFDRWLVENQYDEFTDERIQELYDLAEKGILMVIPPDPDKGIENIRQVRTVNGKVVLSDEQEIMREKLLKNEGPEAEQALAAPLYVPEPTEPKFGFWSRLGYRLGMDTDYARLMRFKKELHSKTPDQGKLQDAAQKLLVRLGDDEKDYVQDKIDREDYLKEFEKFKNDPRGIMTAVNQGARSKILNAGDIASMDLRDRGAHEVEYFRKAHNRTKQGKIQQELNEANVKLFGGTSTRAVIIALMGERAERIPYLEDRKLFGNKPYDPPRYSINLQFTRDEKGIVTGTKNPLLFKGVNTGEMAAMVCMAAAFSTEVAGDPPIEGETKEDTALLRGLHILSDIFARPRNGNGEYLTYLYPAREVGARAMNAYADGDVKPVANLMAQAIRQLNIQTREFRSASEQSLNAYYITGKLLEILDRDPALMEAAGLTEDELEQARGGVAYRNVIMKGIEAKKTLMEYGLYRTELTPEQIREAAGDVLFAQVVTEEMKRTQKELEETRKSDSEYQKLTQERDKMIHLQPQASTPEEMAELDKKMQEINRKLELYEFNGPYPQIKLQLLDEDWQQQSREELLKSESLDDLVKKDREDLGRIASSDLEFAKAIGKPMPKLPVKRKDEPGYNRVNKLERDDVKEKKTVTPII